MCVFSRFISFVLFVFLISKKDGNIKDYEDYVGLRLASASFVKIIS